MNETIRQRLAALRAQMQAAGITYYLMTSSDAHASEYVGDYFKVTEFVSGCTSDNVILLISSENALLWTDGRYFISAARELDGTGITLMKDGEPGVPRVEAFLRDTIKSGDTLGFDGRQVSAEKGKTWRAIAEKNGASVSGAADLISPIWENRPALASHPLLVLPEEICGQTFAEKLADLRADMAKAGAKYLVLSKLDDICWLTNLRGFDVDCNPVALSYALVTPNTFELFLQESELTDEARAYAARAGITLRSYEETFSCLAQYDFDGSVLCDSAASTDAMWQLLTKKAAVIDKTNPTELRKACKNAVEMENIRKFYLLDSVALCRFIYFVKQHAADGTLTEMAAARKLDALRAEIPGFLELSFPTIPAFNANAAMAHYAAEGDGATIEPHGFLLVDSGGQYLGATTDVTRTIVLGDLTAEMKRDFTLVEVAHTRLLKAIFKKGTTGHQLDMLAREPLYAYGIDYGHGTGHGIGYILNVHEGPQRIGSIRPGTSSAPMEIGMLTSDEPGIYRENEYGIRTESITLTVPHAETEFGTFYAFECLTFAPIDLDAIDKAYMNDEDVRLLNDYHKTVYEKIAPYLNDEERAWLADATREI